MRKDVTAVAAVLFEEHGQGPMEDRHKVEWAVQWGLVTPADADAWARERGEEPFQYQPDPAGFDPMSLEEWTFAMATAWIIWRTPADVCRAWEPYATECRTWHSIDYIEPRTIAGGELIRRCGFEARPGKAPAPHDVIGGARAWIGMSTHMSDRFSRSPPVVHPNEVEGQIIAALRRRDGLVAFHSVMPDEPIDRYEWAHLSPFTVGKGPHDAVFYPSGKMVRFSQVRVKRETVRALWPVVPDVAPIAVEAAAVEIAVIAVAAPEDTEVEATIPSAGRPSLWHLYQPEYERRRRNRSGLSTGKEAVALKGWLECEVREGRANLDGAALPSVIAIKRNIQRWRKEEKDRTKNGPK